MLSTAFGEKPPKATIAVCTPHPDIYLLESTIAPPLAHAAPVIVFNDILYSSVKSLIAGNPPPIAKPAVCIPAPPSLLLAVPKVLVVVQLDPSYCSALFV